MFPEQESFINILRSGFIDFYHSPFVLVIKIFLGVYSIILILNIIMLLYLRGLGKDLKVGLRGTNMPLVKPNQMQKRWTKVLERLDSGSMSQYKVAILEADSIVDDILRGIGYAGENMTERLMQIQPHQFDYLDELKGAHEVRNRIVHEVDFSLDKHEAQEVIKVYEKILRYLEFL